MIAALIALLGFCPLAFAASPTTTFSDLQVTGQQAVGTYLPRARFEIEMSSTDAYALLISSQNFAPLCAVDRSGNLSAGVTNPQARIDVAGSGDSGTVGLELRVGNSSFTTLSRQITFGAPGADLQRHSIGTRHVATQNLGNAIDFFLWTTTGSPSVLSSTSVLSLQAIPQASSASVHIDPAGDPDVELEVSNLLATGGGRIHRLNSLAPSSRAIKTDISYLGPADEKRALDDVLSLQHATYRYKRVVGRNSDGSLALKPNPQAPLMRGLIFEDVPASIRGTGNTVVLDDRVANLELALKLVDQRIEAVQAKIDALRARKPASKRSRLKR